jgi:hypothetical protein
MKTTISMLCVVCLIPVGCSREAPKTFSNVADNLNVAQEPANLRTKTAFAVDHDQAGQEGANDPAPVKGKKPQVARKIKYTADLKLITDEFEKAKADLEAEIKTHQGYEAFADVQSTPGAPRVGTWKVRVPVEQFATFRSAVRKLGEVVNDTVNTEDLTEQYYDLEANIKNLRAEQESWRDMLKKTTDKVENLIAVKRELDRVTDDIQRKEGRLRVLANLTELTTVNVQVREREKYVPAKGPDAVEKATFAMRAGKTWGDSWDALLDFIQVIGLLAIAVTPWLPFVLVAGVVIAVLYRRHNRAPVARATPNPAVPPTL